MAKSKAPEFTVIIDSREQLPYEFFTLETKREKETKRIVEQIRHDWNVKTEKLDTGDYSIEGYEGVFTIERKSLSDFMGCVFEDRFDREMHRMNQIPHAYLLIEATFEQMLNPELNRRNAHPNSILGKLASYGLKHNVQLITTGSREGGMLYARALLRLFYEKFHSGELHSMRI